MIRKSPVTVQQWVDSLPPSSTKVMNENNRHNCHSPKLLRGVLAREASIQSDEVSLCSSLESMLELRRPDPEAVLLGLGFGPSQNNKTVSRIPQRFLNPSKLLKDIDIQKFLEQQGEPQIQGGGQYCVSNSPAHQLPKAS